MIHPHLLVLALSGGRGRGLGCPGLGMSVTLPVWWTRWSRRVTVDTLQPHVAALFYLVLTPMSTPSALFRLFFESHGITVPKLIQHQLNFFSTTLICLWNDVRKKSKTCICHVARDSLAFLQNRFLSHHCIFFCRNYQRICNHKRSTSVILNFEASAMFHMRVIHNWNVCVFKSTEHII